MKGSETRKGLAGAPHYIWQVAFFGVPLITLLFLSFQRYELGRPLPGVSLENYWGLLNSSFPKSLLISLSLATAVAITGTILGTASVMAAWLFRNSGLRFLLLSVCSLVFFSGVMPRAYALQFLLASNGPLHLLWTAMPIAAQGGILNTGTGIFLANLSIALPLILAVLFAFRNTIDETYLDCARDLGASEWTTQMHIVLPLLTPGIIASIIMGFILTLGDVVIVVLIGGSRLYTAPMQILDFIRIDDWGRAAAGSVVLLSVAFAVIALGVRTLFRGRRDS